MERLTATNSQLPPRSAIREELTECKGGVVEEGCPCFLDGNPPTDWVCADLEELRLLDDQ